MDERPICYLDCGGVVYYSPVKMKYQSRPQHELRPHLISFLKTIHDCGYELRILSGDPAACGALNGLMRSLFVDDFPKWRLDEIPNAYGNPAYLVDHGADLAKAGYVDISRPFIWIEDCVNPNDYQFLVKQGMGERLFTVDPFEPDELLKVKAWIRSHPFSKRPLSVVRSLGPETSV